MKAELSTCLTVHLPPGIIGGKGWPSDHGECILLEVTEINFEGESFRLKEGECKKEGNILCNELQLRQAVTFKAWQRAEIILLFYHTLQILAELSLQAVKSSLARVLSFFWRSLYYIESTSQMTKCTFLLIINQHDIWAKFRSEIISFQRDEISGGHRFFNAYHIPSRPANGNGGNVSF